MSRTRAVSTIGVALLAVGCQGGGEAAMPDLGRAPTACQKVGLKQCGGAPTGVACLDDLLASCVPAGYCDFSPTLLLDERYMVGAFCFDSGVSEATVEDRDHPNLLRGTVFKPDGTVCYGFRYGVTAAGDVTITYTDGGQAQKSECFSVSMDVSVVATGGTGAAVAVQQHAADGTSSVRCTGQEEVVLTPARRAALAALPVECGGFATCRGWFDCMATYGGGGG